MSINLNIQLFITSTIAHALYYKSIIYMDVVKQYLGNI